jgi:hypothetical protein
LRHPDEREHCPAVGLGGGRRCGRHRSRVQSARRSLGPRRLISARRTLITCLAGPRLRNTELCQIDVGDFAHGTINVADAKTEAGVCKGDLSPMLRDELLAWRAPLGRAKDRAKTAESR